MISDAIAFESAQMSVMSIRLRKNENNNNNNQIQNSHSQSAFDTLSGLKTQIKHVQTLILKIICNTVMSTNGGFKHFGSLLQLARLSFLTNPPLSLAEVYFQGIYEDVNTEKRRIKVKGRGEVLISPLPLSNTNG